MDEMFKIKFFTQLFILGLMLLPQLSVAEEKSCFPVGRAFHDRECYDFDTPNTCLETKDIYSCAWGIRRDDAPSDDDQLICDHSRCPNLEIPDEDEE
jgi:hypothetical protein